MYADIAKFAILKSMTHPVGITAPPPMMPIATPTPLQSMHQQAATKNRWKLPQGSLITSVLRPMLQPTMTPQLQGLVTMRLPCTPFIHNKLLTHQQDKWSIKRKRLLVLH